MNGKPGKTKHCVFGGCKSDSRYGPPVEFIAFPKGCLAVRKKLVDADKEHVIKCFSCNKCDKWIKLCKRKDGRFNTILQVDAHKYICKNHFVDVRGPCEMYPEPLPADKAKKIRDSPRQQRSAKVEESGGKCKETHKRSLFSGEHLPKLMLQPGGGDMHVVNAETTKSCSDSNLKLLATTSLQEIPNFAQSKQMVLQESVKIEIDEDELELEDSDPTEAMEKTIPESGRLIDETEINELQGPQVKRMRVDDTLLEPIHDNDITASPLPIINQDGNDHLETFEKNIKEGSLDCFGKYIASLLRYLPIRKSHLLQQEMITMTFKAITEFDHGLTDGLKCERPSAPETFVLN